jgi:flagellar hook-associated protein 1
MSLLAALQTQASAMEAYQKAFDVIGQNLANASTVGYAKERMTLKSLAFQPQSGMLGGVAAQDLGSARNAFAEGSVWSAAADYGRADQFLAVTQSLTPYLDTTSPATAFGSVGTLFSAFAAWATAPDGSDQRTAVVNSGEALAAAFHSFASELAWTRDQINTSLQSSIGEINGLLQTIADYNKNVGSHGQDSGAEASAYAALENLSAYIPITSSQAADGTINVHLAGQNPLVMGGTISPLSLRNAPETGVTVQYPGAGFPIAIFTAEGTDVTSTVSTGKLQGLLEADATVTSLIGNAYAQGSLNQLAQSLADRINGLLTSGQVSAGPPPTSGKPMFVYNKTEATSVAATLAVATSFTGSNLAAIDPGPPAVNNGIAAKIAGLEHSQTQADLINGYNYADFAAAEVMRVATLLGSAQTRQTDTEASLEQARGFRTDVSGVSLEEESVQLLAMQRGYEAATKVLKVLDELLQATLSLVS